jgi:hypothetical protein
MRSSKLLSCHPDCVNMPYCDRTLLPTGSKSLQNRSTSRSEMCIMCISLMRGAVVCTNVSVLTSEWRLEIVCAKNLTASGPRNDFTDPPRFIANVTKITLCYDLREKDVFREEGNNHSSNSHIFFLRWVQYFYGNIVTTNDRCSMVILGERCQIL